jgi:uncharacterized protein YdaL
MLTLLYQLLYLSVFNQAVYTQRKIKCCSDENVTVKYPVPNMFFSYTTSAGYISHFMEPGFVKYICFLFLFK